MNAEEFMERLCGHSHVTEVWFVLWEGGGAYTFTEILRRVGGSRSWLSESLWRLLVDELIRVVDEKYQAVAPEWLRGGTGGT